MIVEQRTYTLQVGTAGRYLQAYEEEGLAIQRPILGNLIGYFQSEFGTLNQVVHLWGYDDLGERDRRRKQLYADAGWNAYVAKVRPFVLQQESRILIPAPFSPIGGIR